jgi:Bacterial extracellular solute-binding proteins, family 5 Middle
MHRVFVALLAMAAAVAPAGCVRTSHGTLNSAGRHRWTVPGVLRIGTTAEPGTLNPMLEAEQAPLNVAMFVYSWAIRYNSKARPFPDALSEVPTIANGDVSKDGLTLRYKLRNGMTWQDGQRLTCNDLKFTWRAVMNPHNNVTTTDGYRDIRTIDCSNPLVAVIHMKKPTRPFSRNYGASTAMHRFSRRTFSPGITTTRARSTLLRIIRCRSAAGRSKSSPGNAAVKSAWWPTRTFTSVNLNSRRSSTNTFQTRTPSSYSYSSTKSTLEASPPRTGAGSRSWQPIFATASR